MVWAYDAKRRVLCRKEGDVNGSTWEEEERKALGKMVGQCRGEVVYDQSTRRRTSSNIDPTKY